MGETNNKLLYAVTVLIWGSTWLGIKFQLGVVAPEVSIAYRFTLAAAFLMAFIAIRRLSLRFKVGEHALIALQGFLLFSLNYYLVYITSQHLTSGLVAIIFSTIVIFNSVFGALFLGNRIRLRVVIGSVVGLGGLAIVFRPELVEFDVKSAGGLGLLLGLVSTVVTSGGNILSARNQRAGLPVVQTNALGMAYGSLLTLGIVLLNGRPLSFDPSAGYVLSLGYLALFGSVIAFGTYLTLLGRIGPDRAAYVTVLFPIVALILSTLFEDFEWTFLTFVGVALVLLGNVIVLTRIGAIRARLAPESGQAS